MSAAEREVVHMSGFDIAGVLDEAWRLTKKHYWSWLLIYVVAIAIPIGIIAIGAAIALVFAPLGGIVILVGVLAFFYTFLGLFRNAYNASEGAKPSVGVLLRSDRFWWFLVAGFIFIGIVVAGLLAFIIPGLIFGFMFGLFPYALISQPGTSGFAALAKSWELITTAFWRYIGLRVVLFGTAAALAVVSFVVQGVFTAGAGDDGVGILSVILLTLGFVIAAFINVFIGAFTYLADALAYRRLSHDGEVLRS